jgi:type I restriction enzyme S subunit
VSVSEWREVRIGDIGDVVTGKTPSSKNPEYFGDEIPFVTPTDYKNYHKNIYSSERYLSQAGKEVLGNKLLPINSVIVTCIGSDMGKVAINKVECITNQQINSIILKRDLADSDFIYYTLISMQEYLKMLARGGTTMPIVNKSTFEEIKLLLPPFPEQKAIAATLSALDDMIELNNQINKTLEEMAQAIFKSWFVDFEPFKNGEFEESELGLIPKGWRVGKLSDVGEIIGGGTPSKSKPEYYAEIGIPWITPKDLSINKNKYISRGEIDISELGLRESSARLMPKGTVLFSSRAPIGYIAIAKNAVTTNQGFKSVVPFENISSEYIYLLLKNSVNEIESRATGSTFKEISGGEMKKVPIILPPKEIIRKFNEIATTLGKTQASLEDENSILMSIRDTLLPKLMTGEIRVPVEEVV